MLQRTVQQRSADRADALREAAEEADGTGGSHRKLVGSIALLKMKIAEKQDEVYHDERRLLVTYKASRDSAAAHAKAAAASQFRSDALLLRIKAMLALTCENAAMCFSYIILTAFLFCLEYLVVIVKAGSRNSVDEEIELARALLLSEKAKRIVDKRLASFEPGEFLQPVKEANSLLSRKHTTSL